MDDYLIKLYSLMGVNICLYSANLIKVTNLTDWMIKIVNYAFKPL